MHFHAVWGPPLQQCQVAGLQHLQNGAVRVTKSLRKYDRVSAHRNNLNWLPISHQIKLRSSYMCDVSLLSSGRCLLLDPPIHDQYGRLHLYRTRCREDFASVALCRFASTKGHFRFAATTWWNSLPSLIE